MFSLKKNINETDPRLKEYQHYKGQLTQIIVIEAEVKRADWQIYKKYSMYEEFFPPHFKRFEKKEKIKGNIFLWYMENTY